MITLNLDKSGKALFHERSLHNPFAMEELFPESSSLQLSSKFCEKHFPPRRSSQDQFLPTNRQSPSLFQLLNRFKE